MRPIDADALKELLLKERDAIPKTVTAPYYEFSVQKPNHTGDLVRGGIKKALRCMENTPTLTLDDLRSKGEWIKNGWNDYSCSKCETQYVGKGASAWNYCPNCGHPMEVGGK